MALRESTFHASLLTSGCGPQSLAFLGLPPDHPSLCLRFHMTFSPVFLLCFSVCSHDILTRTPAISFGAHPDQEYGF